MHTLLKASGTSSKSHRRPIALQTLQASVKRCMPFLGLGSRRRQGQAQAHLTHVDAQFHAIGTAAAEIDAAADRLTTDQRYHERHDIRGAIHNVVQHHHTPDIAFAVVELPENQSQYQRRDKLGYNDAQSLP